MGDQRLSGRLPRGPPPWSRHSFLRARPITGRPAWCSRALEEVDEIRKRGHYSHDPNFVTVVFEFVVLGPQTFVRGDRNEDLAGRAISVFLRGSPRVG